jgi:glycosyltransferase involved in cell wall biosynthesis
MLTFIIPSIGRPTLQRAINSLLNQTHDGWKAIVVFDGIEPTISAPNEKVTFMTVEKSGVGLNGAGAVRNYGMKCVETEWIAFLDDDDTVANDYVEYFFKEIQEFPQVDVVIFRMRNKGVNILPPLETDNFYCCKVGISFAFKKKIVNEGNFMTPSGLEDYNYLNSLRAKKYCIMISPYVKYFVRGYFYDTSTGNRVILNYIRGSE